MGPWNSSGYDFKRFNKIDEVVGVDKFKTFSDVKEISDGIYSYKNFMGKSFNNFIKEICDEFTEEEYEIDHYNYNPGDMVNHDPHLHGKIISALTRHIHAQELLLSIRNLFSPQYCLFYYTELFRLQSGQSFPAQTFRENIISPKYKIAYFCGDFTGGEISFKHIDLHYKVEPDELIIFDASYLSSINEVKSGTRYSYINYIYNDPGVLMI